MNSLERVLGALKRTPIDRVPVAPLLGGVTRYLVGVDYPTWSTKAQVCAEAFGKAADVFQSDFICTLIDLSIEAADFGQQLVFPKQEAAYPDINERLLKGPEDYRKIILLDPRKSPRMKMHLDTCRRLASLKGDKVFIAAFVFGPLGVLSMLRGQAELYLDLYDEPEKVKQSLEIITEVLLEYCDALCETGIHAVMFNTLFASASIMSKDMWVKFEAEPMQRLAERVRGQGKSVMVHNCGEKAYFDAQIAAMAPAAISFLHTPEDCADMADCKKKYGEKVMLIGCLAPTELPNMSQKEVIAACRTNLEIFAGGGGFMLSTGCEYPANLSLEHARTIVESARKYGRY